MYSTDGHSWMAAADMQADSLLAVACVVDTFVAVGENGTVLTSPDGSVWTRREPPNLNDVYWSVAGGEDMVVLAAAEVTSAGTQRQMVSLPAGALEGTGVLPLSQPFKLPGNDASPHTVTVVWSDDSLTWHTVDKGLHEDLAGIAYGNEKFVAAGRGGLIAVSAEGAVWHREQVPVSSDLLAVVVVGDTYVVVGASGPVLTSSDGSRWTQRQTGTRSALFGVAAQSVTILATGDNGVTLISPDAIHWSSVPTTSQELLYGCAAGGGTFVAVGANDTMLWTRDLLTSAAPAPLSPADGATVSGATVNLAWSAVPGAVTYELELSAQST